MGNVLHVIANRLGTLITQTYDRRPITDPHLLFAGFGDVEAYDQAPLQVTQFEADIRIAEQLQRIYFEGGGGGNVYESYILVWYFAAFHTKIDCFDKRQKKGYLFTIGDEEITPKLNASDIEKIFGYRPQKGYTAEELFELVSQQYEVFHLMIEEGNYCQSHKERTINSWTSVIGQRARLVSDHTKIAEIIVSILQEQSGMNRQQILASWDDDIRSVVEKAVCTGDEVIRF